jgi:hypothetical protein
VAGELDVNINDNEFTGNLVGLVLSERENGFYFSAVNQRATLRAAVSGNRMIGNSQYGMALHAPQGVFTNNDRLCPRGIPAEIHATFSANSFAGNGRNDALFTFTAVPRTTSGARACYIRDSLMDSDYTGAFDYDNPDQYGNTLRVNGQEYEGQSITP